MFDIVLKIQKLVRVICVAPCHRRFGYRSAINNENIYIYIHI